MLLKTRSIPSKRIALFPRARSIWRLPYGEWFSWVWQVFLLVHWSISGFSCACCSSLSWDSLYNVPPIVWKICPTWMFSLNRSTTRSGYSWDGWRWITLTPLPISLIIAYWMIGAFFMTVKRYAEYARSATLRLPESTRKSFTYYNEYRLILSIVYYASAFSLFFGIFLIRYRIELVLSIPFLAGFIPVYMRLGFWSNSPAQYTENLYKQKRARPLLPLLPHINYLPSFYRHSHRWSNLQTFSHTRKIRTFRCPLQAERVDQTTDTSFLFFVTLWAVPYELLY